MKNLNEHLRDTLCDKRYNMPHKYSFITLEEFCELNNISIDNTTDEQINYFYEHYGESRGLPASKYDATHTHNDWIIENLQSEHATDFVKQYKYIYHVTNKANIEKILKRGLRPNTKKTTDDTIYRYYTDRLFLIVGSNNIKNDLISVIQDLGYSIYSEDYIILKIDISKLNFTFWWDDASKGNTVYTVESIPPKFIEVINIDNV